MFPITFNAFGDIVTAADILRELAKALSETHGAPEEYRKHISNLRTMAGVMMNIYTIMLVAHSSLDSTAHDLVLLKIEECCGRVQTALSRIAKFDVLGTEPGTKPRANQRARRAWSKIEWHVFHSGAAAKVEEEMRGALQSLGVAMTVINHHTNTGIDARTSAIWEDTQSMLAATNAATTHNLRLREDTSTLRSDTNILRADTAALRADSAILREDAAIADARSRSLDNKVVEVLQTLAAIHECLVVVQGRISDVHYLLSGPRRVALLGQKHLVVAFKAAVVNGDCSAVSALGAFAAATALTRRLFPRGIRDAEEHAAALCALAVAVSHERTLTMTFRVALAYIATRCLFRVILSLSGLLPPRMYPPCGSTLTVIDIFDVPLCLPLEICTTWEDFHESLQKLFTKKRGEDFIRRREYTIADRSDSAILGPSVWMSVVRGDLEVEMSFVVRGSQPLTREGILAQLPPRCECPWCRSEALQVRMTPFYTCTSGVCARTCRIHDQGIHDQESTLNDTVGRGSMESSETVTPPMAVGQLPIGFLSDFRRVYVVFDTLEITRKFYDSDGSYSVTSVFSYFGTRAVIIQILGRLSLKKYNLPVHVSPIPSPEEKNEVPANSEQLKDLVGDHFASFASPTAALTSGPIPAALTQVDEGAWHVNEGTATGNEVEDAEPRQLALQTRHRAKELRLSSPRPQQS